MIAAFVGACESESAAAILVSAVAYFAASVAHAVECAAAFVVELAARFLLFSEQLILGELAPGSGLEEFAESGNRAAGIHHSEADSTAWVVAPAGIADTADKV